jgi:hypothetical protein
VGNWLLSLNNRSRQLESHWTFLGDLSKTVQNGIILACKGHRYKYDADMSKNFNFFMKEKNFKKNY